MPIINPLGVVAGTISAGTSTATLGEVVFSNSNNVSFGISGQTVTASVAGGGGGGNTGSISAGTTRATLGEVVFSNSNGLSFGVNGQTITGSYTVPSTAGLLSHVNVSAGTTSNNVTNVVFSNSNNVSFGLSGSTITGSVASSLTNIGVSAGTTSNLLSNLVFDDSNGISFGIDGQTVTASYTVPAVTNSSWTVSDNATSGTVARLAFTNLNGVTLSLSTGTGGLHTVVGSINSSLTNIRVSAGTTSNLLSAITFSNSNGVSFGLDAGTITASIATSLTNIRVSAGTTSNLLSAITFSNANGISFGLDASTITASHNALTAQSNQTLGLYAVGNTTGESSSSTFDARTVSYRGHGIASVGFSDGSVNISVSQTVQTQGFSNTFGMSNLGNTSGTSGVVSGTGIRYLFAGGPNITLSQSIDGQSATLTISGGAGAAGNTGTISAGTTNATLGEVIFSDSNNVSFGLDGQTITATVASSLTNIRVSAGTTSNLLSAVTFSNSNGISFGLNASTITASHNAITSQSNQTLGLYAVGNTVGESSSTTRDARTISYRGQGIASVGFSDSSVLVSVPAGSISAGTTRATLGEVVLSNSNGISFGVNGQTVTASYTVPVVSNAIQAVGSATGSGTNTSRFAADDHVHEGVYSAGVSNVGNTAGNTGVRPGRWVFAGSNVLTLSQETAANSLQTIHIQGPAQATTVSRVDSVNTVGTRTSRFALEDHQHAGIYQISVAGNTAGNTSAGAGSLVLAGGPNVTLSGSTAGGGMTLSVSAPAGGGGGGGVVYSAWNPFRGRVVVIQSISQGRMSVQPVNLPDVSFDRVIFPCHFSGAAGSTGTMTVRVFMGIYTNTSNSFSLFASSAMSTTIPHSGTASSASYVGFRKWAGTWDLSLSGGNYWFGINITTTTGGANLSYSHAMASAIASAFSGRFGVAGTFTNNQYEFGLGVYSATATTGVPNSFVREDLSGLSSAFLRQPMFMFGKGDAYVL